MKFVCLQHCLGIGLRNDILIYADSNMLYGRNILY
jgi:hypothetical protein